MALEVFHPNHTAQVNGWVALTETDPWPRGPVLNIRDTALALSGGSYRTAVIALPRPALEILGHIAGANGTFTGWIGTMVHVALGATYVTNAEPAFADANTMGIQFNPTIIADTNEGFALVGGCPQRFKIKLGSGATGGANATTCDLRLEIKLIGDDWR